MMTYNEAKKICEQSDCDKICITVEPWVRVEGFPHVSYSIWDGRRTFTGETLEIAMLAFMVAHPVAKEQEPPESTAAVFAEMGGSNAHA